MSQKSELDHSYPSNASAWYAVTILTIAYVVSFLDRQLLSLVVPLVKRDLLLTDTQVSLLLGLAFALFYTTMGIPIGRLADKKSRRAIIAVGISFWCLMTAACGLAKNYMQLFLARVGVGVGEATLSPSSLSMIGDYFPKEKRGKALGVFNIGVSVGSGIAFIVGGQIIAYVATRENIVLPIIGEIFPWQALFIMVGLPGLIVAALMMTVKEPKRTEKIVLESDDGNSTDQLSIKETINFILERKSAYGWLFLSMACSVLIGYAFLSWMPTMYDRTYGIDFRTITMWLGIAFLVSGPIGAIGTGWLGDYVFKRYGGSAHIKLFAYTMIVLTISATLVPLMPTYQLATLMFVPQAIMAAGQTALAPLAILNITPNQLRAQVAAIYFFVISLTGYTLGPTSVALLTDYVFKDESLISYSMAVVSLIVGVIGIFAGFMGIKPYRKYIETDTDQSLETTS